MLQHATIKIEGSQAVITDSFGVYSTPLEVFKETVSDVRNYRYHATPGAISVNVPGLGDPEKGLQDTGRVVITDIDSLLTFVNA